MLRIVCWIRAILAMIGTLCGRCHYDEFRSSTLESKPIEHIREERLARLALVGLHSNRSVSKYDQLHAARGAAPDTDVRRSHERLTGRSTRESTSSGKHESFFSGLEHMSYAEIVDRMWTDKVRSSTGGGLSCTWSLYYRSHVSNDKSTNRVNFGTSEVKKKKPYMPREPKFCVEFESELRSYLPARNEELSGSGVS